MKATPSLYRVTSYNFYLFIIFNSCWILLAAVCSCLVKFKKSSSNIIRFFAVQDRIEKLFTIKRSKKAIKCLDGIRSMSITWVIIGHIVGQNQLMEQNLSEVITKIKSGKFTIVTSTPIAVDSFFVIGGLLSAYIGWIWKHIIYFETFWITLWLYFFIFLKADFSLDIAFQVSKRYKNIQKSQWEGRHGIYQNLVSRSRKSIFSVNACISSGTLVSDRFLADDRKWC